MTQRVWCEIHATADGPQSSDSPAALPLHIPRVVTLLLAYPSAIRITVADLNLGGQGDGDESLAVNMMRR